MKYAIGSVLATLVLVGCGTTKIVKETEKVGVSIYPNLLALDAPQGFEWEKFKFDIPRDMAAAPVVKATPGCKAVPTSKHDDAFWKSCGEQPPLKDSNIIVGFDAANFAIFRENLATSAMREAAWLARLTEVNKQRAEWRMLNERVISETGAAPALPTEATNDKE